MVKVIIDGITELSKLAEEEEGLVQTTLKSVEELTSKSMNIEAVLTKSISESEKITSLTKSQVVNSKDLQTAIASISELSQNNAAVSQQISATSEDQIISVSAVMDSINEMVQGVNETKTYTNNFIKGFVINDSIKSKISDLKNILNEMVKKPEVFKGSRKSIEDYMLKYQNSTDYIELMIFIGPDGFGIAETKGLEDKYWKDCTMKGYFHAAMKGETYISKEYISKSSGNYNITLSVPVKDGGKIIGVIMADIDINEY